MMFHQELAEDHLLHTMLVCFVKVPCGSLEACYCHVPFSRRTIVVYLRWDITTLSCQKLGLSFNQSQLSLIPFKSSNLRKELKKDIKNILPASHQNVYSAAWPSTSSFVDFTLTMGYITKTPHLHRFSSKDISMTLQRKLQNNILKITIMSVPANPKLTWQEWVQSQTYESLMSVRSAP